MTARRNQHADVESQATVVADNTGAGLAFGDKQVVDEIIGSRSRCGPTSTWCASTTTAGGIFSRFQRAGFDMPAVLACRNTRDRARRGHGSDGGHRSRWNGLYPRQLREPVQLDAAAVDRRFPGARLRSSRRRRPHALRAALSVDARSSISRRRSIASRPAAITRRAPRRGPATRWDGSSIRSTRCSASSRRRTSNETSCC